MVCGCPVRQPHQPSRLSGVSSQQPPTAASAWTTTTMGWVSGEREWWCGGGVQRRRRQEEGTARGNAHARPPSKPVPSLDAPPHHHHSPHTDPITGAPSRGRRGRAGRPTASQLDDDDDGFDSDIEGVIDETVDLAVALPSPDDDDDVVGFLATGLPVEDDDDVVGLLDAAAAPGGRGRRRKASAVDDDDALLPADIVGLPDDELLLADAGSAAAAALDAADDEEEDVVFPDPPHRAETVGDLLARAGIAGGFDSGDAASITVTGIDDDVDHVARGDLFVCSLAAGDARDAALAAAAAAGAAAALVLDDGSDTSTLPLPCARAVDPARAGGAAARAFYDDSTSRMSIALFVGGPGKTTASWLMRGVLDEAEYQRDRTSNPIVGMMGSLEYAIYTTRLDARGGVWTPDEPDPTRERDCSTAFHAAPYIGKYPLPAAMTTGVRLQRVAAGMADRGAASAVVELSASAVSAGAADGLAVDVAVYMGAPVLEDGNPDEEGLAAIVSLFERLDDPDAQRAVVNADDPAHVAILTAASRVPAITYAMYNKNADVFSAKAAFGMWDTEILARTPVGALSIQTRLICRHNVGHVLAAVSAGLAVAPGGAALDLKTIVLGVEGTPEIPGRCETIDEGQKFLVVVDAAATPIALARLLDGVREAGAIRIITVLGCKGGHQRALRPFIGEVAHYKSNIVILTNDSPGDENPADIVNDIVTGFPDDLLEDNAAKAYPPGFLQDPGRVDEATVEFLWQAANEWGRHVCEDRWMAIRWAIGTAQDGDAVVIAGKGAEDYQLYAHRASGAPFRGWFDDRVEARNALARVVDLRTVDPKKMDRSELPWEQPEERDSRAVNAVDAW